MKPTGEDLVQACPPAGAAPPTAGRRPVWWRELLLVAALYAGYDLVHGLITGARPVAERDGADLLHWERLLHLDPEHLLNNALQHAAWLAVPACFFYATLHFVITPAVLIWTYHRHQDRYRNARNVIFLTTAAALIGFWRFPTAPPRLLTGAGFHDTLASFSNWGWWGADASVPAGAQVIANQFAAMPSLHVAWALWSGLVVARLARRRWLQVLGAAYPVLTVLVVLSTANHYLFDVIAGAVLLLLMAALVRYLDAIGFRQR